MTGKEKGAAVVVQPDEGESYWQPVPANGYAEVLVSRRNDPSIGRFSSGIQVIAPGGRVREHQHPDSEELLFFFEGRGRAIVDDVELTNDLKNFGAQSWPDVKRIIGID